MEKERDPLEEYIGFYWTRRVNWAGFRELPTDVNQAAKLSRTIKYQVETVRGYVRQQGGAFFREFVCIDNDPKQAPVMIDKKLVPVIDLCKQHGCWLVYVDFGEVQPLRRTIRMREILRNSGLTELGLEPIALPPESLAGFNPIRHFQEWQATDFLSKEEHVNRVRHAFEEALLCVPEGRGRPKAIANYLNDRSILTIRGKEWNQSNVEKFFMSFSRN